MAWTGVITNAGANLLDQWALGGTLTITSAATGTGTVDTAALVNQTNLKSRKQTASIISKVRKSSGVKVKLQITAPSTGYTLNQYGVWAKLGSGAAVLLALFQREDGVPVPSSAETPEFVYTLYALLTISNTGTLEVTVDTSALVSQSTLEEAMATKAAASHTHAASDIGSGTLPIVRGGTGQATALAAITALGGASIASRGIEIQENTDLNSLTTPGTYYSPDATRSATLGNPPLTGAGFKLYVIQDYGSTSLLQVATTIASISYINQTYLRGGTTLHVARPWSDWYRVSFSGHTHAADNIISGTLPITRGGTGQTTAKNAATSLLTSLGDGDTVMRDETLIATSKYDGTTDTWYKRPASLLWSYIKGKADALYAAAGHKHDDRYPTLLDGTVITSSADDPADLNDATYQVPGTYNCRRAVVAATVKHTPYYDTTTLVNADMLAFVLRVSYGVGTNQSISQELRTLNDGCVYYRYLQVSSGIWTAWDIVRGTASGLNQRLTVSTTDAQDTLYFATTAASGETGTWYKRPASAIWNYMKTKAAAELYITAGKKSGTTLGEKATAEGQNTTASGSFSPHAEGVGTVASGETGAHAEGSDTVASGEFGAHAEGVDTVASGRMGAHAEGLNTVASGDNGAHAEGNHTTAAGESQHVFGKYNVLDTEKVEIVGWGSYATKKNIRTLDRSGNMTINGTLTQSSDARLKDVHGEVPNVSSIRAVRFKWNDTNGEHDDKDHIGYIAQDVEKIAPFLVGDDSNGYKSLDYIALLCAKVEMLERRVAELEGKEAGA